MPDRTSPLPAAIEARWRLELGGMPKGELDRKIAELTQRYLDLRRQLEAIEDHDAVLDAARKSLGRGELEQTERQFLEYLAKRQTSARGNPRELANVLFLTAQANMLLTRIDDARELAREALRLAPGNRQYVVFLLNTYMSSGQLDEGLAEYQRYLDELEAVQGTTEELAAAHSDMGWFLDDLGRYDEAWVHHQAALDIVGPDASSAVASVVYGKIGGHYNRIGDYPRAVSWLDKGARTFQPGAFTDGGRITSILLIELAIAHDGVGDFDAALHFASEAMTIAERASGPRSPELASVLYNTAHLLARHGRIEEAIGLYLDAYEILLSAYGENNIETAYVSRMLGGMFDELGEPELALQWLDVALSAYQLTLGDDAPQTVATAVQIGEIFYFQGQHGSAVTFFSLAVEYLVGIYGETLNVARVMSLVADSYDEVGDPVSAVQWYQRSLEIGLDDLLAQEPAIAIKVVVNLSALYHRAGEYALALVWLERVAHVIEQADPQGRIFALAFHGKALVELDRLDEAHPLLLRAIEGAHESDSKDVLVARSIAFDFIADLHEKRGEFELALHFARESVKSYESGGAQPHELHPHLERVRTLERQLARTVEPSASSCSCSAATRLRSELAPLLFLLFASLRARRRALAAQGTREVTL